MKERFLSREDVVALSLDTYRTFYPGISEEVIEAMYEDRVIAFDEQHAELNKPTWKYGDPTVEGQCGYCGTMEPAVVPAPGEWPTCPGCGGV